MNKKTPLYHFHTLNGAKIAPFAGYDMPIQYETGIKSEHLWVREHCGLFDVSHMGQVYLNGPDGANILEKLTPTKFSDMPAGRCRYTVLTNATGGILDDMIVTKIDDMLFHIVLNASRKNDDIAWMQSHMPNGTDLVVADTAAMIALQGPKAMHVLNGMTTEDISRVPSMSACDVHLNGIQCMLTRTGYSGEDGFEIYAPQDDIANVWDLLINHEPVKPIGLGARDSLRIEAGFPLYGHDLDETTSPVEASLAWVVTQTTPTFMGADRILKEKAHGAPRKRVGIQLTEKGIARENDIILTESGGEIGKLCSGGFGPSVGCGIGQAYLPTQHATVGGKVAVQVRGRSISAAIHGLSFLKK